MKAKFSLSEKVSKLMKNNRFVAAIALVLAIVFWLVISIAENPQRTVSVGNIPVNFNTQNTLISTLGLDIVSKDHPETVSVSVSGPSYIVSSLMSSDISVTADLSDVTAAGTYEVKLEAARSSRKSGYSIVSVSPATITVTFDVVDTKTFDLNLIAVGASAAEGLVAEEPVLSDSSKATVELVGPHTEMEKIASVSAVATVNKVLEKTTTFEAELVLNDINGDPLDASSFTMSFDTVNIAVPIFREKVLPVSLDPSAPTALKSIPVQYSSPTVTVCGEPTDVDGLTTATLSTIDLYAEEFHEHLGETVTLPMTFNLPASARVSSAEEFTAAFDLKGYTSRTVRVTAIKAKDLAAGNSVKFSAPFVDVVLYGPAAQLNAIQPTELTVFANCSGKTAGTYYLSCTVDTSTYSAVWASNSITVSAAIQ